ALAVHERRADGDRRVHAGDDVGDRHAGALRTAARRSVGLAGDAHHAAHALDHEIVARPLAVRAGLAETGHRAIDDARIELAYIVVAEPVAREVAVLVILDQHVGALRQLARDRLSLRHRDVQRHRFLAAIGGAEIGRVARIASVAALDPRRAEGARIVAASRPLELDHLGTQIGEVLARPRAGEY